MTAGIWTDDRIAEAVTALRAAPPIPGAVRCVCTELSERWGFTVSDSQLHHMLRRRMQTTPSELLGTDRDTDPTPPPSDAGPPDPVGVVEEKIARKNLKRERDTLVQRLRESEARNAIVDALGSAPRGPVSLPRRERTGGLREACAVILASDWHVEETVDPATVAGINAYDLDIAKRRASRFFDGIEWLIGFNRQTFTLRDVVLWLGGDLLSGYIHEELAEGNALSPTQTLLCLRDWLTGGINRLLADKKIENLIIPCSYGNHGRTSQKKRVATGAANSYEWLLYSILAHEFRGEPRVRFEIANGEHCYVVVYGKTLHFTHGDSVRYNGGVGGLSVPLNKAIPAWNTVRPADYHHLGHYHCLTWLRDAVVNGSLIGYGPIAFHVKAAFERPQQAFYVLDANRGRSVMAPIWVEES